MGSGGPKGVQGHTNGSILRASCSATWSRITLAELTPPAEVEHRGENHIDHLDLVNKA